jgi:gliding motility-associated-like protein
MNKQSIKYSLIWILWMISSDCFGQKENNNWYFGCFCGITFNTQPPSALLDGQMVALEGCASISNAKGKLLFYTNGVSVWNSSHEIMPHGNGLNGDISSTQSAIIVPVPDSAHLYYIFTTAAGGNAKGLQYSVVNMKLNGGTGDIVQSKKNVFLVGPTSEKLVAIKKPNLKEYWIVVLKYQSDELLAYNVSKSGIDIKPIVSRTGMMINSGEDFIGTMKISPNGKKIAMAQGQGFGNFILVGDFDINTGTAGNWWRIRDYYYPYGIEFSPKSQYLYVTSQCYNPDGNLRQYDLNKMSQDSFVGSKKGIIFSNTNTCLQLGPDGKIYISTYNSSSLSVIHSPDSFGISCRLEQNYIFFPDFPKRVPTLGLPPLVMISPEQKWIINADTTICVGDSAQLTCKRDNIKNVVWSNGSTNFNICVRQAGKYWVKVTDNRNENYIDSVVVKIGPKYKVYIGPDTAFCGKFSYLIKATLGFNKYLWNTGDSNTHITVNSKGIYTVKVLDSNSCPGGDTTIVTSCDPLSYYIPNSFTPNNDGLNDVFKVTGVNIANIAMSIYNRWGEKIFESTGKDVSWNGQYNNIDCPEMVYIYKLKIKGTNPNEIAFASGNVTLLR